MACPGDRPFVPLCAGTSLVISEECGKPGHREGPLEVRVGPLSLEKTGACQFSSTFMGWQFPVGVKGCLIKNVGKVLSVIICVY